MNVMDVFKFCPRCKSELKVSGNLATCPECGLYYYDNPRPCCAAILKNSKGEVLLTKRALEPKKGYWDLPGGFIDKDETLEEGIARELLEELGVVVKELKYIGSASDWYDYREVDYPVVGATFVGQLEDDASLNPQDDVADYKFFLPEDLPLDKIAFPSIRAIIADLQTK